MPHIFQFILRVNKFDLIETVCQFLVIVQPNWSGQTVVIWCERFTFQETTESEVWYPHSYVSVFHRPTCTCPIPVLTLDCEPGGVHKWLFICVNPLCALQNGGVSDCYTPRAYECDTNTTKWNDPWHDSFICILVTTFLNSLLLDSSLSQVKESVQALLYYKEWKASTMPKSSI